MVSEHLTIQIYQLQFGGGLCTQTEAFNYLLTKFTGARISVSNKLSHPLSSFLSYFLSFFLGSKEESELFL